jgi:hypothetical protein
MLTKFLFPVTLLLLAHCAAFGQRLPTVTLPSPEAASLFRYLDYPVNHATSVANIDIPLYEVQSGELRVPISLNYHSSGRRVTDETGAIGLGWTLNAGGMISRIIYGDPDDNDRRVKYPSPWKYQSELGNSTTFNYLAGVDNLEKGNIPWYDTEYDVFSYAFGGVGGKFVLRDNANVKTPVLIPKKPFKVTFNKKIGTNTNYYDFLTVTDDKGVIYRFGKSLTDGVEYIEDAPNGKSGWLLTEITFADGKETIQFKYKRFTKERVTPIQESTVVTFHQWQNNGQSPEVRITEETPERMSREIYTIQRLTEIRFTHGKVLFNLERDANNAELDMVKNIQVFDQKNALVKTIDFNRTIENTMADGIKPVHRLNYAHFKDKTGATVEKYTFGYYPTLYASGFTNVNVRFCDLWGYYNASGKWEMRPYYTNIPCWTPSGSGTTATGNPGSNRDPNEAAARSGVLKTITYPTGGTTEFVYQNNRYQDPTSGVKNCGGLRVYQIKTRDANGNENTRTFKYGANESGHGALPLVPGRQNMVTETTYKEYANMDNGVTIDWQETRKQTFSSNVVPLFSYIAQKPVIYTEVTEYLGTETDNIGKTIYTYDNDESIAPQALASLFMARTYRYWKYNALRGKADYKRTVSNGVVSYALVKQLTNTYLETEHESEKVMGLHVAKAYVTTPDYCYVSGLPEMPSEQYTAEKKGRPVYSFGDYTISVGAKELSAVEEISYSDNGTFSTRTTYEYNQNQLVSRTQRTASNGDVFISENKYPTDYTITAPYPDMVSRNMLNYVVESQEYKNAVASANHLQSVKTSFKNWGNNVFAPEIVSTRQGSRAYEDRVVYRSYDAAGNVQQVARSQDANDVSFSYLWGYNKTFPIAEVKNAALNPVNQTIQHTDDVVGGRSIDNSNATGSFYNDRFTTGYTQTVIFGIKLVKTCATYTNSPAVTLTLNRAGGGTATLTQSSFGVNPDSQVWVIFQAVNLPAGTWYFDYQATPYSTCTPALRLDLTADYVEQKVYQNAFHTSFEEDTENTSTQARTGKQSRVGTLTIPKPPASGRYRLTYWSKANTTSGSWTLQESVVTVTGTSGDISVGSTGNLLDEVRLHPLGAHMTTFTCDPLYGMTSQTDASNATTYYVFDEYGRLDLIKDQDGNILKQYNYRYKDQ